MRSNGLAVSASAEEAMQYTGHIQSVRPVDAGTFVVVTGRATGSVQASRVEISKIASE